MLRATALTFFIAVAALRIANVANGADAAVIWSAKVQKIFDVNCVKCHGPLEQKGGLELEPRLGEAMKANPHLRVLVCQGLRDLAVPPDAMAYSLNHLPIPESLRANITIATFDSGHMMYLLDKDAAKLREDIVGWLK